MARNNFFRAESQQKFKVLITTSGVGSRLGDFTKFTNKCLVKVGDKLAISHIIEKYPVDTQFVITLGHFGEQVRDFLCIAYPERHFDFVKIENFQETGSSLGLSMLTASKLLQTPFIYHASDTLVLGHQEIELPEFNWVAGSRGDSTSQYASFDVSSGRIMNFHDKGMMQFDFIYIGLVGIYDFKTFWTELRKLYDMNPSDGSLNDLAVLSNMKQTGSEFDFVEISNWHDMGNTESLAKARKVSGESHDVLEKSDESISFVNGAVVKFFADKKMIANRVTRAVNLGELVPKITSSRGNFYRYEFVEGNLYSKCINTENFGQLLNWANNHLWKKKNSLETNEFTNICRDFYENKTVNRVNQFLEKTKFEEKSNLINGVEVPKVFDILGEIDFKWLSEGIQGQFHGDFILDNIVLNGVGFKLIDWRQDFGGQTDSGDINYDFAKLNHSLVINHQMVNNNKFSTTVDKNGVYCDIDRKQIFVDCEKVLERYLIKNDYNLKKIRVLTGLIWLNMAPLHHHPFDLFLFNFGKLKLWEALKND
jgi:NDP-sugar pyrophosphorylase family protein